MLAHNLQILLLWYFDVVFIIVLYNRFQIGCKMHLKKASTTLRVYHHHNYLESSDYIISGDKIQCDLLNMESISYIQNDLFISSLNTFCGYTWSLWAIHHASRKLMTCFVYFSKSISCSYTYFLRSYITNSESMLYPRSSVCVSVFDNVLNLWHSEGDYSYHRNSHYNFLTSGYILTP